MHRILAIIVFFSLFPFVIQGAYFSYQPYTIQQPDGETIECFVSGDEFFNFLHDAEGYTIIQSPDGYFYYGIEYNGIVIPSSYKINTVLPSKIGLKKWAKISQEEYNKKKNFMNSSSSKSTKGPSSGTINSLVIYIRFSDDTEFTTTRSAYDAKFNAASTSSLKNYFKEVSYDMLDIVSHHYPICALSTNLSYQDTYPRNYYQPYNASTNPNGYVDDDDRELREHTLLVNAVNGVKSEVPTALNIDADNDNRVDNVSFIIRGNSGAWAELLWAHRWSLNSQTVNINGKQVWDYTFEPENQTNVSTLCHEMFHVVGAPDLYRYSQDGFNPVGAWDLMASGFVHMSAFMKWKYTNQTWINSIPEITTPGTYTLFPVTSPVNNAYRIASPNNPDEYFVLEYRKKEGLYETNVPGSGIVIYRINTTAGNGNAGGPPDEVYLYRPNGTLTDNGNINNAYFSQDVGRTSFNDQTNPNCFLSDLSPGGIEIFDVTTADDSIQFTFGIDYKPTASFEAVPRQTCTGTVQFVDKSTKSPTSWFWDLGDGTTSTLQNPQHTYSTNGYKTIKLKVTNSYGIDSLRMFNYVRIDKPSGPSVTGSSSCTPASLTLQATASTGGTLIWYDQQTGGTALTTGSTFQTPVINQTTTFYVEELTSSSLEHVGADDNTIGDGGYFNNNNTHYLVFDCYKALTLKSVNVYAQSDKDRTIVIKDANNNILHDTTVFLTEGEHRLELNFMLQAGSDYKIECTTPYALLYRNSNGTNFPYIVNNLISIHNNSASNLSYYYYFYDWEVIGESCISVRKPVVAGILNPQADFTYTSQNLAVSFQNTSLNASLLQWHFGDGQTSGLINPQHAYDSEGYYEVKLVISNNTCGADSITKIVPVFYQGLNSQSENMPFVIYPNPVKENLKILFNLNNQVKIEILNLIGDIIYSKTANGNEEVNIPFFDYQQGVYILNITADKRYSKKIIKL